VQNLPRYQAILFRKYEWGLGQTGEINCSNTFVLTAFNFLGGLNIFRVKRVVLLGGGSCPMFQKTWVMGQLM
jgi:hypothetical protein